MVAGKLWALVRTGRVLASAADLGRPGPRDPVADTPIAGSALAVAFDAVAALALVLLTQLTGRRGVQVLLLAGAVLFVADALRKALRVRRVRRRRRELRRRYGDG